MPDCQLLDLCQELRDVIYEYALAEDENASCSPLDFEATTNVKAQPPLAWNEDEDHDVWQYHLQRAFHIPIWLNLKQCNRQLYSEVSDFLARRDRRAGEKSPKAEVIVNLNYPTCTALISHLQLPPDDSHILDVRVTLRRLYHKSTLPPSQAIASAIWHVIQRYSTHGPHLGRTEALTQPLDPKRVRIRLEGPRDEDLVFLHGLNPWMQMHSHYSCLKMGLGVIARRAEREDGLAGLQSIETKFARRGWEKVFVAKDNRLGESYGEHSVDAQHADEE